MFSCSSCLNECSAEAESITADLKIGMHKVFLEEPDAVHKNYDSADQGPPLITISFPSTASDKLGITMDLFDETLCFVKVLQSDGKVPEWNATCEQGQDVKEWYRLMSVNGFSGPGRDMVTQILTDQSEGKQLEMVFKPPFEFQATIDKNGRELGLKTWMAKNIYLAPTSAITTGALRAWNDSAGTNEQISPSSRIIRVDGQVMSGEEIIARMEGSASFKLTVLNWL